VRLLQQVSERVLGLGGQVTGWQHVITSLRDVTGPAGSPAPNCRERVVCPADMIANLTAGQQVTVWPTAGVFTAAGAAPGAGRPAAKGRRLPAIS
jgi:hypothetical protein